MSKQKTGLLGDEKRICSFIEEANRLYFTVEVSAMLRSIELFWNCENFCVHFGSKWRELQKSSGNIDEYYVHCRTHLALMRTLPTVGASIYKFPYIVWKFFIYFFRKLWQLSPRLRQMQKFGCKCSFIMAQGLSKYRRGTSRALYEQKGISPFHHA